MAEDKVEGLAPEGEQEGSSLNPEKQESIVIQRAREKNWKPLEEYNGDPADWVDAKEFLGRQKLYDRINDLKATISKQTHSFQKDMQVVLRDMQKVREQEYTKALKSLEKQRTVAAANEDVETVVAVSKEIEDLKEEKAEQKAQVQEGARTTGEATPEFLEWQANNKWFSDDAEMRQDAISFGVGYAAGNPNKSQAEVLDYVTKKIKKVYPEKFEKKDTRKVDNQVERGGGLRTPSGSGSSKTKLTMQDLPDEHQTIAETIIKSGALKKAAAKNKRSEIEEYVAQYQSTLR